MRIRSIEKKNGCDLRHPEEGVQLSKFHNFQGSWIAKKFLGRIASMHPRNDIKNWQAVPTSGTSLKEGLKSFFFFYSKFINYIQFYSAKLLFDTHKVIKKIINPLGSPKIPLRGCLMCSIFCRILSSSIAKKFFGRIASMHPQNDIKNWQAAPTSGTSLKEGLKSFIFFYSKFINYIQFYSAKLLLHTRKVITNLFVSNAMF